MSRKNIIYIAIPALLILVLISSFQSLHIKNQNEIRNTLHAQIERSKSFNELKSMILRNSITIRNYLITLDQDYLDSYQREIVVLTYVLNTHKQSYPLYSHEIGKIHQQLEQKEAILSRLIALRNSGDAKDLEDMITILKNERDGIASNIMQKINNINNYIYDYYAQLIAELERANQRLMIISIVLIIGLLGYFAVIITWFGILNDQILSKNQILKRSNKELQEVNALKDKFFNIVAHDLRSPFNGILVSIELLEHDIAAWENKELCSEYMGLLKESAQSYFSFLEGLLLWARSQITEYENRIETINVCTVIAEVEKLFQISAQEKNISLVVQCSAQATVEGDYQILFMVLRNVVSNAIKFSRPGGRIDIACTEHAIRIKDDGIGMSETVLQSLFKIDVNYKQRGTSGETGAGVGLVLCKDMMEKIDGTITVHSRLDAGTEVILSFPAKAMNGSA